MANLIKVTPENLRDEAGKVRNIKTSYSDSVSRLNNLVYIMTESWEGEAQRAFTKRYQESQKNIRQLEEFMNQLSKEMEDIASRMQNTDTSLAAKIRKL